MVLSMLLFIPRHPVGKHSSAVVLGDVQTDVVALTQAGEVLKGAHQCLEVVVGGYWGENGVVLGAFVLRLVSRDHDVVVEGERSRIPLHHQSVRHVVRHLKVVKK